MDPILRMVIGAAGVTVAGELLVAMVLSLLGPASIFTRAPWLDGVVAVITWVPWMIAGICGGGWAVLGTLVGQFAALYLWIFLHEMLHREATKGPRIVKFLNRIVGRWRNHAALLFTLIALPGFWLIRLHEWLVYPFLIRLLNFPRYKQAEWVNVSRQKFEGLVGHDLIWCLYCDWMTGVYSLGAEMLRNVESFWCPIRFYEGKKCANCNVDFPDIQGGWVPATGTMKQVEERMEEMYAGGQREWFGHPARLTVGGKMIASDQEPAPREGPGEMTPAASSDASEK
jgi:hypothetical protein